MAIEPVIASQSVAEHLREAFRKRQSNKTIDLEIPGYSGGLFGTFRALDDYAEVRDAIQGPAKKMGISEADRDLEIAVNLLLLASVSSYAIVDGGQRVDIPHPLGLGLYDYIFPAEDEMEARPGSDSEAVHMLFQNSMALMRTAGLFDQWSRGEGALTDEELVQGN